MLTALAQVWLAVLHFDAGRTRDPPVGNTLKRTVKKPLWKKGRVRIEDDRGRGDVWHSGATLV
jgi:hypothetical protein